MFLTKFLFGKSSLYNLCGYTAHKNVNVKADQLQTHQNQKTRNDLMTFFPSLSSLSLNLLSKKKAGAKK